VNRHEEVVRKLDPKLVAMLDGFINSDAAKVIYLNRGYPMLSDMMVLMIDNYYSSQN
jgi:hypothetical protein